MARQKKDSAAHGTDMPAEYLVRTVSEMDREVYSALRKAKAARPDPDQPGGYIVTDIEKAKSQAIMPEVLNKYGRVGWRLLAVNKMECFIFGRPLVREKLEYKVMTPTDMDKMSVTILRAEGAAEIAAEGTEDATLRIFDPAKAKIQNVLPKVLASLSREGWGLAAISGPQLYIFVRSI